ncbi:cytochrome P450 [Rhodoferax sp. TBRC 17660]|uniref:Cytochrome P450 n=1 Tax=Rhodoferax potami TaxID=3068338 RepID=A0ABU3KS57_9BURK|nr:cytochrome P450 [Rhodoferax sp. TBRC 17660]MDT7520576.1 cytochrome P450 [Rhodoferax sp. TBRC 17660]
MNAVLTPSVVHHERPIVSAAFLTDPYPAYRALREAGPIHWSEEFFGGAWLLSRHADVEAVLRDPRFSAQRTGGWVNDVAQERGELAGFQKLFARALLFLDGGDHARLRAVMQPAFRPDALARLRPGIERIATELLQGLEQEASFDFIEKVARPLPVRVISRILGIEGADRDEVMAWSDDLAVFIGAPDPTREQARKAQSSLLAMTRYLQDQLATRRKSAGDDLLSALLRAADGGDLRGEAELLAQCAMLLFAGHETTRNLLGNGIQALLSHPQQWQLLRQHPNRVPNAVRELLRFDSPVQYTGRRVVTDLTLHGQRLCRGDLVIALIGAANRDPARHVQPDTLDIQRADPGALSFGSGAHVCLGAALARLEAEVVLRRLLTLHPNLLFASTVPQWGSNPAYRGLVMLPVRSGQ